MSNTGNEPQIFSASCTRFQLSVDQVQWLRILQQKNKLPEYEFGAGVPFKTISHWERNVQTNFLYAALRTACGESHFVTAEGFEKWQPLEDRLERAGSGSDVIGDIAKELERNFQKYLELAEGTRCSDVLSMIEADQECIMQ